MIVYQISLFDYEMANFDPYEILEVREFALNQIIYNQPVVPGEYFGGQEADQIAVQEALFDLPSRQTYWQRQALYEIEKGV